MDNDQCEHGHIARKCEVCELRDEVARLRSVCGRLSNELRVAAGGPKQDHGMNVLLMKCVANARVAEANGVTAAEIKSGQIVADRVIARMRGNDQ